MKKKMFLAVQRERIELTSKRKKAHIGTNRKNFIKEGRKQRKKRPNDPKVIHII